MHFETPSKMCSTCAKSSSFYAIVFKKYKSNILWFKLFLFYTIISILINFVLIPALYLCIRFKSVMWIKVTFDWYRKNDINKFITLYLRQLTTIKLWTFGVGNTWVHYSQKCYWRVRQVFQKAKPDADAKGKKPMYLEIYLPSFLWTVNPHFLCSNIKTLLLGFYFKVSTHYCGYILLHLLWTEIKEKNKFSIQLLNYNSIPVHNSYIMIIFFIC